MAVFDEKAKQLAERAAAAMAAAAAQPAPTAGSAASKKKKRKEKQIEKKLEKMNERRVPSISNTKDNKVKVPKGKPASTSKPQDIKDRTMSSDEARLLREIKLLGGTETDLHLIQDIDSGSEIGDDADAASSKMSNAQMADDDVEVRGFTSQLGDVIKTRLFFTSQPCHPFFRLQKRSRTSWQSLSSWTRKSRWCLW
ncbi:hypothetical protein BC830DRAFT_818551 [Chytriomyces sp. MP71]|nr:hypothetical protein BC830DRAFT_818551 [Chytriomyces sp. MP71]